MERRKFTGEFKLEAVRLIKDSRRLVCSGVRKTWVFYVAAARLGEDTLQLPDNGATWRDGDLAAGQA